MVGAEVAAEEVVADSADSAVVVVVAAVPVEAGKLWLMTDFLLFYIHYFSFNIP